MRIVNPAVRLNFDHGGSAIGPWPRRTGACRHTNRAAAAFITMRPGISRSVVEIVFAIEELDVRRPKVRAAYPLRAFGENIADISPVDQVSRLIDQHQVAVECAV